MDGIPRHFGGCVGCQRSIRGSLSCQVARRSKFKGTGIMTEAVARSEKVPYCRPRKRSRIYEQKSGKTEAYSTYEIENQNTQHSMLKSNKYT